MCLATAIVYFCVATVVYSQSYGAYNENFAVNMLNMAAAAHASDSQVISQCLKKTFPTGQWKVLRNVTVPCDGKNNMCQAFTAISHYDMTILISFRGTEGFDQLLEEIGSGLANDMVYYNNVLGQGSVIRYFYDAANIMYASLDIAYSITNFPNYNIWVTGHSLGGALASLTALKLVTGEGIQLVTFGEPRIGDYHFAYTLRSFLPNMFRVVHGSDPIPHGPPCGEANDFCTNICPLESGKPFHAPQEIWYSQLTKEMVLTEYQICNNEPNGGEDPTCSNSVDCLKRLHGGAEMHLNYFNHSIPDYGKAGCADFAASHSISAVLVCACVLFAFGDDWIM
uniref:Lipase_3 domain-containing protein n=1 Tax=Steinernema glaseri TaxID=37863 RepID=A0A1I7Y4M5_9BILA